MIGGGPAGSHPVGSSPRRPSLGQSLDQIAAERFDRIVANSYDWTGVEIRLRSDLAVFDKIRTKLSELDALVDQAGLTNSEKQQVKASTEAICKLVDAPAPDWKSIAILLLSAPITLFISKPVQAAITAIAIVDFIFKSLGGS